LWLKEYKRRLKETIEEGKIPIAIERASESYRRNLQEAIERFPYTLELAEEVRSIKEEAIRNLDSLFEEAKRQFEKNRAKVFLARTSEEACEIIGSICGNRKVVVKGKSLTAEEISLREYLEEKGYEVYETDLGEFLIQITRQRPMHILSPAIHMTREEVSKVLSAYLKKEIPPDIGEEVKAVREFLREKFFRAEVGITGANVVSAQTGTLILIENEGNVRLTSGLPSVHIALVGLEKLVFSLSQAMKVAEVTWRFANYAMPAHVSLVSTPSKTGDIEKVTTFGAHGPKELYVVFLDNGRRKLAQDPIFREALYCLRCGGCLYECPVFRLVAGRFGDRYFGGIGAIWTAFISGDLKEAAPLAWSCLTCGRCKLRCPMKIDTPQMCLHLRSLLVDS
jgi:L-lactate dehydrogenase complex protein LldG